jgi:hypothetical protein
MAQPRSSSQTQASGPDVRQAGPLARPGPPQHTSHGLRHAMTSQHPSRASAIGVAEAESIRVYPSRHFGCFRRLHPPDHRHHPQPTPTPPTTTCRDKHHPMCPTWRQCAGGVSVPHLAAVRGGGLCAPPGGSARGGSLCPTWRHCAGGVSVPHLAALRGGGLFGHGQAELPREHVPHLVLQHRQPARGPR